MLLLLQTKSSCLYQANSLSSSFRGSKLLDLQSTDFFYDTDRFLSENGTLLTDHNPVRVEFSWTLADNLRQSELFGGPHGCVSSSYLST